MPFLTRPGFPAMSRRRKDFIAALYLTGLKHPDETELSGVKPESVNATSEHIDFSNISSNIFDFGSSQEIAISSLCFGSQAARHNVRVTAQA